MGKRRGRTFVENKSVGEEEEKITGNEWKNKRKKEINIFLKINEQEKKRKRSQEMMSGRKKMNREIDIY